MTLNFIKPTGSTTALVEASLKYTQRAQRLGGGSFGVDLQSWACYFSRKDREREMLQFYIFILNDG